MRVETITARLRRECHALRPARGKPESEAYRHAREAQSEHENYRYEFNDTRRGASAAILTRWARIRGFDVDFEDDADLWQRFPSEHISFFVDKSTDDDGVSLVVYRACDAFPKEDARNYVCQAWVATRAPAGKLIGALLAVLS